MVWHDPQLHGFREPAALRDLRGRLGILPKVVLPLPKGRTRRSGETQGEHRTPPKIEIEELREILQIPQPSSLLR